MEDLDSTDIEILRLLQRDAGLTHKEMAFESHHYPFEVLMDLKDSTTGLNKVVDSYQVKGIPSKFVIDRDGKIRFRFTGFFGDDQAAIEEISTMIEMAHGKDIGGTGRS